MSAETDVRRTDEHNNAMGILRLLFASLVIVSHTPAMVDGNLSRELLTRAFRTISFGEMAVDAFFVVSGFLITASFIKCPDAFTYLGKRVARIYPGFIVASLICLFVVAPLGQGHVPSSAEELLLAAAHILFLLIPDINASQVGFAGSHYPSLNGAAWTISYEFRCYLLVLALGLLGAFRRPPIIAVMAIAILATSVLASTDMLHGIDAHLPKKSYWWGQTGANLRLTGQFLVGSLFYLYRHRIHYRARYAAAAAVLLVICLCYRPLAEPGSAFFGGYLIFFTAFRGTGTWLSRINSKNDVSYGLYLYAWPIEKLLIWYFPSFNLWQLGLLTFLAATAVGTVSWHVVEKPTSKAVALLLKRRSGPVMSANPLVRKSVAP